MAPIYLFYVRCYKHFHMLLVFFSHSLSLVVAVWQHSRLLCLCTAHVTSNHMIFVAKSALALLLLLYERKQREQQQQQQQNIGFFKGYSCH